MRKTEQAAVNAGAESADATAVEKVCARILGGVLLGMVAALFALAAVA